MKKLLNILLVLCLFLLFVLILIKASGYDSTYFKNYLKSPSIKIPKISIYNDDVQKITINPPISLSYKTKAEVYELRKQYVKKSIFASKNYEPSEEVFGQIEDGAPWISINGCSYNYEPAIVDGPSEETRFINNPSVLVGIEYPFYMSLHQDNPICTHLTIPYKAEYNRKQKEITVYYKSEPKRNFKYEHIFNGINARDFGYSYVYVDINKSKNVIFLNQNSVKDKVAEFQNFIHLGGSCHVEGGCNNGSPYQADMVFKKEKYYEQTVIYLKLWKHRPFDKKEEADINEIIVLDKI